MIPFDFEYYKPTTIPEAIETYQKIHNQGKTVTYYNGGTEFITFSRLNEMTADVVIDLKGIPECHVYEHQGDQVVIGASVSLNQVSNANLFPLLGQTVKQIADHTSRNKITLGGNLKSQLIYREGILPLLLAEAKVKMAGPSGELLVPIEEVFDKELKIHPGHFLTQVIIDKSYTDLPFVSLKKTKMSKVGYPVVSIAALVKNRKIRIALSGVCLYPFRSTELEAAINDTALTNEERIEKAVSQLPSPIVTDIQGSAEYREFVLRNTLLEMMEALEVAQA